MKQQNTKKCVINKLINSSNWYHIKTTLMLKNTLNLNLPYKKYIYLENIYRLLQNIPVL